MGQEMLVGMLLNRGIRATSVGLVCGAAAGCSPGMLIACVLTFYALVAFCSVCVLIQEWHHDECQTRISASGLQPQHPKRKTGKF